MKRALVLLLSALWIAACGTGNPPSTVQWCFRFYFAYDDYGFSTPHGEWVPGVGFAADSSGDLSIGYVYPRTVYPEQIILRVVRVSTEAPADIDVTASALIFGLSSGTLTQTLPGLLNSVDLSYTAQFAGDAGTTVNITAHQNHSDQPLALQFMEVRGRDVSPFGASNCDGTPTPSPIPSLEPSFTPSSSPTATITPTPSETPTWSPTPTSTPTATPDTWSHTFEFDSTTDWQSVLEADGWTVGILGSWVPGEGIQQTYQGHYTDVMFSFDKTFPYSWLYIDAAYVEWELSATNDTDMRINYGFYDGMSEYFYGGSGVEGAIGWHHQDALALPKDSEGNFGNYQFGFFSDTEWQTGTVTVTTLYFAGHGFDPFADLPFPMPTPTDTPTATITRTPTRTPNPNATATLIPRTLSTPFTATPIFTASPTRAAIYTLPPLATLPPPATSWATVTAAPTYTPNASLTYEFNGTLTATYGGTGTPAATGTAYNIPWPTTFPGSDGSGGDGGQGGIAGYGNGLLGFASNAMQQGLAWLGELRLWVGNAISGYQTAEPLPLPGLPQCSTDRLASELCAIYYILTYTLFSGTLGALIVPIGVIDIDIVIVYTFIKLARAILARLAEILKQ